MYTNNRWVLEPVQIEDQLRKVASKYKDFENFNGEFKVEGANARWLVEAPNRTPKDPVIMYVHGGGFVFKTDTMQIEFIADIYRRLGNPRVSVLIVDYTVTPRKVYPGQLRETAAIYKKLTEDLGCKKVILLGDSCGCNLCIALMAYIKHGHPTLPEDERPTQKPLGAVFCSPWVNLVAEKAGSYENNKDRDILPMESLNYWGLFYCEDEITRKSVWVSPVNSEPEFWEGAVPDTLVTWGEDEVMKDDCMKWAKLAGVTMTYEEPQGFHDCALWASTTPTTDVIVQFLYDKFSI